MMIGDILPVNDPVRNTQNDQIDDLWDGLNLGGLLNDLQQENDALMRAKRLKDPFFKQKKVLESPAYSVLMDRYHTRPPQPKLLTKKTLDRLSDPIKGRIYESPPKQKVQRENPPESRERKTFQPVDVRTKIKPEKIQKEVKIIPNPNRNPVPLPVRYHSPIRRDSLPDDEDEEENSPSNISIKKDSDSFFLTGTGHGEVNMRSNQRGGGDGQGYEGYHPVMDVRIDIDRSHKSNGNYESRDPDEIYTSRTREYLQDALRRGQSSASASGGTVKTRNLERARDLKEEKMKSQRQEHHFQKEINSKRTKGGVSKSSKVPSRREKKREIVKPSQREKKPSISSSSRGGVPKSENSSSKWASSREVPVTKTVPARKLLVPVAGLPTKRTKTKRTAPSSDNLIGLERVDESHSYSRSRRADPTILRSNSSSASRTKSDPLKPLVSKGNLIGSHSAPALSNSSRKSHLESDPNLSEDEENKPAYRRHAPAPSRLLPGRSSHMSRSGGMGMGRNGSAERNKKIGVTLDPLPSRVDSLSNQSTGAGAGTGSGTGVISRTLSGKGTVGRPPLSSQSQSLARSTNSSNKITSIDPADDQMAALFAAHAKKLSDNLDKASSLSMKYQRLKEYDGLTASQRDNHPLSLPKKLDSISEISNYGKVTSGEDAFDAVPPKLTMII